MAEVLRPGRRRYSFVRTLQKFTISEREAQTNSGGDFPDPGDVGGIPWIERRAREEFFRILDKELS